MSRCLDITQLRYISRVDAFLTSALGGGQWWSSGAVCVTPEETATDIRWIRVSRSKVDALVGRAYRG
jgi:hypothetical protein